MDGGRPRFLAAWIPPLIAMTAIFLFSSRDAPEILKHQIFDAQDKAIHAFVYFVLAGLFLRALLASGLELAYPTLFLAAFLSSLYGASDEWHQSFVPTRQSDFSDWVADTVGACLVIVFRSGWGVLADWEDRFWQGGGPSE